MVFTLLGASLATALGLLIAWLVRRFTRRRWPRLSAVVAVGLIILTLPAAGLAVYLSGRLLMGQPAPVTMHLADGVDYRTYVIQSPYRATVHVVEIAEPARRRLVVTPPVQTADGPRNQAGYATAAIESLQADLLINANFFTPFRDNWVLDAYPGPGDFIEPIGPVIADGVRYGRAKPNWPSIWQGADGRIGCGPPPDDARAAVTGRQYLLKRGVMAVVNDEPPYPRTAVAVDEAGGRLWLVVVDGKQPRYSDGMPLTDLARFLAGLGASDAIELDGGGSSILVRRDASGPELLNRPCHTKIPARQRPTGVFLGIRFED